MDVLVDHPTCECGAPATANGRECPFHFRQRLRSVRLDGSVTETRTKTNYFDKESLDTTFGEDRVQTYWDDTKGMGALEKVGDHWEHTDWHGERHSVDDKVAGAFARAPEMGVDDAGE